MNKYVPTFEEFINEGVDYKTTLKLFKDAFSSFNKKFKVPFNENFLIHNFKFVFR